ncbi:MAG: DUF1049 domain-containing protein [Bacteroidetes bacterium]|nr:DUF1049 domain-containing protein [Bacteroidota bacterium]MBU1718282.1 DUF1049 domain-containing protein [Bacteroidota bacterium]
MSNNKDKATISESVISMDFSKLTTSQKIKLVVVCFVFLIFLIAFIQNFDSVQVKFVFWSFSLSISLLILLSVLAGALALFFRGERKVWKKKKTIEGLEKKIEKLQMEIDQLKKG